MFWGNSPSDEAITLNLSAEDTLYVRFNANRVRQNTDVQQMVLSLQLQSAGPHGPAVLHAERQI
jgi:hypothetical protein